MDAKVQQYYEASLQAIEPYTLPIFSARTVRDSTPALAGTGVLVQVERERFLVTAAHCVAYSFIDDDRRPILLPGGDPAQILTWIIDTKIHRSVGVPNDPYHQADPVDVAAVCLPRDYADGLEGTKRFLRLNQLDLNDEFSPASHYSVVGFPDTCLSKNDMEKRVRVLPLIWGCGAYHGDRGEIEGFDPAFHAAFNYNLDASSRDNPPDPHGLSGGGVWRLSARYDCSERFDPANLRLVGIVWGINKDVRALRATKAWFVARLLYDREPALRNSIAVSVDTTSWRSLLR